MLAMSRGKTVEPLRPLTLENIAESTLRRFDVRWLHIYNKGLVSLIRDAILIHLVTMQAFFKKKC